MAGHRVAARPGKRQTEISRCGGGGCCCWRGGALSICVAASFNTSPDSCRHLCLSLWQHFVTFYIYLIGHTWSKKSHRRIAQVTLTRVLDEILLEMCDKTVIWYKRMIKLRITEEWRSEQRRALQKLFSSKWDSVGFDQGNASHSSEIFCY